MGTKLSTYLIKSLGLFLMLIVTVFIFYQNGPSHESDNHFEISIPITEDLSYNYIYDENERLIQSILQDNFGVLSKTWFYYNAAGELAFSFKETIDTPYTSFIEYSLFHQDGTPYYIFSYRKQDGILTLHRMEIHLMDLHYIVEGGKLFFTAAEGSYYLRQCQLKEEELELPSNSLVPIVIGQNLCFIESMEVGLTPKMYFVIHPNELTVYYGAKDYVQNNGGLLYMFLEEGLIPEERRRFITYLFNNTETYMDPNRIFSYEHIQEQFLHIGHYYRGSQGNNQEFWNNFALNILPGLHHLSTIVIALGFTSNYPVIALHSNRGYSMDWFINVLKGRINHHFVVDHTAPDRSNPRDFFMVNTQTDYDHLKESGFNVIYLDRQGIYNNGSTLSVFNKLNKRYILIEIAEDAEDSTLKEEKLVRMMQALPEN